MTTSESLLLYVLRGALAVAVAVAVAVAFALVRCCPRRRFPALPTRDAIWCTRAPWPSTEPAPKCKTRWSQALSDGRRGSPAPLGPSTMLHATSRSTTAGGGVTRGPPGINLKNSVRIKHDDRCNECPTRVHQLMDLSERQPVFCIRFRHPAVLKPTVPCLADGSLAFNGALFAAELASASILTGGTSIDLASGSGRHHPPLNSVSISGPAFR